MYEIGGKQNLLSTLTFPTWGSPENSVKTEVSCCHGHDFYHCSCRRTKWRSLQEVENNIGE